MVVADVARLRQLQPRLATIKLRVPVAPKVALPFYQSAEWKALRERVIALRGKRCEHCGREGFVIADHVTEIRDGGAKLDEQNIKLLCAPCHGRKTEQRKRERAGLR